MIWTNMIDNINRLTKTQTNIRDNVNFFIFYLIFCLENNQTCMTTRWRASQFQAVRASTRRTRWRRLPRFGRSRLARPLSSSLKRWFFQHHHDCNQYYHHRDQDRTERICILPLFITKMPCQKVVGYICSFVWPITLSKSAKCKIPHWSQYLSSFYGWYVYQATL